MKYFLEKSLTISFEEAINKVSEELKKEGFGIVAKIDMHNTLKEKLGVYFRKYTILEACNPSFAYRSLKVEDNIGIILPCNIVVYQISENKVNIAAVNPVVVMQVVNNSDMEAIAEQIQVKLNNVITNL